MNNSKTNVSIIQKPIIISFIGMMASGKTKIGKKVSKHFNFTFYDIDEIIEKKYKMTVTKIFKNLGEKTFTWRHWIFNAKSGILLAEAEALVITLDLISRKSTAMPKEMFQSLESILIDLN